MVERYSYRCIFLLLLTPILFSLGQGKPDFLPMNARIGDVLTKETVEYFGLVPDLTVSPRSVRRIKISRRTDDTLSMRIEATIAGIERDMTLSLPRKEFDLLLDYIDHFESYNCSDSRDSIEAAQREKLSYLIEKRIISFPSWQRDPPSAEMALKDSNAVSGTFLYADSASLYLWIWGTCYDWKDTDGKIIRIPGADIAKIRLPALMRSHADNTVLAFAKGFSITFGLLPFGLWSLIAVMVDRDITWQDRKEEIHTAFIGSIIVGTAAMLGTMFFGEAGEYECSEYPSEYQELSRSVLREHSLFRRGYPPEFDRILQAGKY